MKKILIALAMLILLVNPAIAADDQTKAWEVESLVPMFFYGGYHGAIAYRFGDFRVRASAIYSGSYDAEPAGVINSADDFKRFYNHGSVGVFGDYFIWKGLHVFVFLERHNWIIESKNSGATNTMTTIDYGPGIGYQFYINNHFYIQPGVHVYFRDPKTISVGNETYTIPATDRSIVLRLGYTL